MILSSKSFFCTVFGKDTQKYAVKQTSLAGIWDFYEPIHSMGISLIFFNEWQKMENNLYLSFFLVCQSFKG